MTPGRSATVPSRGDVILVPFPLAELTAHKARPAVVVSGREFFRAEGKIVVAAITSDVKAHDGPTNFQLARLARVWPVEAFVRRVLARHARSRSHSDEIGALKAKQLR